MASLPASAISYSPISDADLLRGSDMVVQGEVIAVAAAEAGGGPALRYSLWVTEAYRGQQGLGVVEVVVPGGRRADGMGFWIPGTPRLKIGDRGLWFLVAGEDGAMRLRQHTLGLFHLVESSSRTLAVRAIGDAAVFTAPTPGVAAKGLSRSIESRLEWPRDLDGFSAWLRRSEPSRDALTSDDYFVDPSTLGDGFREKYTLLISSTGSEFGACGENGGRPVRRFTFDDPYSDEVIEWRVRTPSQPGADGLDVQAVQKALAAWEDDPATPVRQRFVGVTRSIGGMHRSDNVTAVIFNDPLREIEGTYDGSGLLAVGGAWFLCEYHREYKGQEFHEITEGDVVVQDGVYEAFETTPWLEELLTQMLAHEFGHTLGIGHTDVPEALMQPNLHLDPRSAALEPDDLAALQYLYGADDGIASHVPPVPMAPHVSTERGPVVTLAWTPVDGTSNYRIERRRLPDKYDFVSTTAGTEYVDVFVDPDTAYEYRLRAQTAAGVSLPSEAVQIVTGPTGRPPAPSQLRAYAISDSRIGLRWQNNACDADDQILLTELDGDLLEVPAPIQGDTTEVMLAGLRSDRIYSFSLRADNQFGSSPVSEAVEVGELGSADECQIGQELCLLDRRFRVSVEVQTAGGAWRPAQSRSDDDSRGFFTFFESGNLEIEARLVEQSGGAELQWSSLTAQTWRLQVVDSMSGDSWLVEPDAGLCGGVATLTASSPLLAPGPALETSLVSEADIDSLQVGAVEGRDGSAAFAGLQPTIPCGRADTDLYLGGGRFLARLTWWDAEGTARSARAFDLTDQSGGFELSTDDELGWLVKILDGRGFNQSFWVFGTPTRAGADVRARLEVVDLQTGATRVYGLPADGAGGEACGLGDIGAFPQ